MVENSSKISTTITLNQKVNENESKKNSQLQINSIAEQKYENQNQMIQEQIDNNIAIYQAPFQQKSDNYKIMSNCKESKEKDMILESNETNYASRSNNIEINIDMFSLKCIYCNKTINIKFNEKTAKNRVNGINIKCPYNQCLQYFYISICPKCKYNNYFKEYIYEGDLIRCEKCQFKYLQSRCVFENCNELFYFEAPIIFLHSPLGIICKHKNKDYFQKLTCHYCLRPITYISGEDKTKRYYEGKKIICPYEDCKKSFNRLICPNCNRVNIVESGRYIMGKKIRCFYCNYFFAKILCNICLKISTLEENSLKYGEFKCKNDNCGSFISMANCLFCLRLNYFPFNKNISLIQGQKIQCGYDDCKERFNIVYCAGCGELNPFPKGDFVFGKLYKCIYGNCSKNFMVLVCPSCFTYSRTIEETEGRKYNCNKCGTLLSNYGCPHCNISILDKDSSLILGQIIQCPNPECKGKFSFCRCVECKRLIYYKEENTIIGKKVRCDFCKTKSINILCFKCNSRISMEIDNTTTFENGETITCPNCREGFIYDKNQAIIIKNEKGEEINLDRDIYYNNLSYINEIKGNTIDYGISEIDPNYLNIEQNIFKCEDSYENDKNDDMTITNDDDINTDIEKEKRKYMCIICQSEEKESIFYPCGHRCCCYKCAMYNFTVFQKCPKCDIIPSAVIRKVFL